MQRALAKRQSRLHISARRECSLEGSGKYNSLADYARSFTPEKLKAVVEKFKSKLKFAKSRLAIEGIFYAWVMMDMVDFTQTEFTEFIKNHIIGYWRPDLVQRLRQVGEASSKGEYHFLHALLNNAPQIRSLAHLKGICRIPILFKDQPSPG